MVMELMAEIRDLSVTPVVNGLTDAQRDTLMKYIFAALESNPENGQKFLKWHVAISKKGVGSIVRVMHDKSMSV